MKPDVLAVLGHLLRGHATAGAAVANTLRVDAFGLASFGRTDALDLFAAHPLVLSATPHVLVSPQALVVLDETPDGRCIGAFADLADGVIARLWVVAPTAADAHCEAAVPVASDDFLSQLRVPCVGDAADHPGLQAAAWPHVLSLGRDAIAAVGVKALAFIKGQPGNPKPRMFRIPAAKGLINRLGFNNDGLDAFIANVRQSTVRAQGKPMLLGLNIGKNAATPIEDATSDYLTCLEGVYPHADYVTVNISSPNTKNLRALQSDEALDALLSALAKRRQALARQHVRRVPLFVKIAPDLDEAQIKLIAATLKRHCMDGANVKDNAWGVVATNTTISREAVKGLPHAEEAGGLSGAPVLEASNRVIAQLRAELGSNFPIIGVGGVMSAQDAVSKITAGADLVQIYTGLIYQGPGLVKAAAKAIQLAASEK